MLGAVLCTVALHVQLKSQPWFFLWVGFWFCVSGNMISTSDLKSQLQIWSLEFFNLWMCKRKLTHSVWIHFCTKQLQLTSLAEHLRMHQHISDTLHLFPSLFLLLMCSRHSRSHFPKNTMFVYCCDHGNALSSSILLSSGLTFGPCSSPKSEITPASVDSAAVMGIYRPHLWSAVMKTEDANSLPTQCHDVCWSKCYLSILFHPSPFKQHFSWCWAWRCDCP